MRQKTSASAAGLPLKRLVGSTLTQLSAKISEKNSTDSTIYLVNIQDLPKIYSQNCNG